MSSQNIFAYTAPGLSPDFISINQVDDRVVVMIRSRGFDIQPPQAEMTLPDEQLLPLAHALIKHVTRKGIAEL